MDQYTLKSGKRQHKRHKDTPIRQEQTLSQEEFADLFGVSIRTLQQWEQGRRQPQGPARVLLKVIAHNPKVVQEALRH